MTRLCLLLPLLFPTAVGFAQAPEPESKPPFIRTVEQSAEELVRARTALEEVRRALVAEQRPLLEQLAGLQARLAALESEEADLTHHTRNLRAQIDARAERLRARRNRLGSVENRLLFLRREFEQNLHVAELPAFRPEFLALEATMTSGEAGRSSRFPTLFGLAGRGLERLAAQPGGHRFAADVFVAGVATPGRVLLVGPYAFFKADAGSSGLVETDAELRPRLRAVDATVAGAVAQAIGGAASRLPFDPLLDQAALAADAETTLWEHVRSGGIWVIPILGFGLVSLLIAVLKIVQIRRIQAPGPDAAAALAEARDEAAFEAALGRVPPAVRGIFSAGFAHRGSPEEVRAAAMTRAVVPFRRLLESRLALLALTAAVAPLLGLLGTVTGMIKTFEVISLHGAGDARALSVGISEALVTTELGLIVAIPALLAHAWLQRRSRHILGETASHAEEFNQTLRLRGGGAL